MSSKLLPGSTGGIARYTFRHTYRSWLDEADAPMKAQQELMPDPDNVEYLRTGH